MSNDIEDANPVTYILDSDEVRKTGRVANKVLKSGKIDQLVEVTPTDQRVGSWSKWVRESDLFEVVQ